MPSKRPEPCCTTFWTLTRTREDLLQDPDLSREMDLTEWAPLIEWGDHIGTYLLGEPRFRLKFLPIMTVQTHLHTKTSRWVGHVFLGDQNHTYLLSDLWWGGDEWDDGIKDYTEPVLCVGGRRKDERRSLAKPGSNEGPQRVENGRWTDSVSL